MAQGKVWLGRNAHALKLADRIGGIYEAILATKELLGVARDAPVTVTRWPGFSLKKVLSPPHNSNEASLSGTKIFPVIFMKFNRAIGPIGAFVRFVRFIAFAGSILPKRVLNLAVRALCLAAQMPDHAVRSTRVHVQQPTQRSWREQLISSNCYLCCLHSDKVKMCPNSASGSCSGREPPRATHG